MMTFATALIVSALQTMPTSHVPEVVRDRTAVRVGALPGAQRLEISVSLPLRNEGALRQLIAQIGDPAGPLYRHYLSVDQFTSAFGPTADAYAAVIRFGNAHHLQPHAYARNRLVLDLSGTAHDVASAFNVDLGVYRRPSDGGTFFAPDREPAVALAVPLLHVLGLDDADQPTSHLVRTSEAAGGTRPTGSGPNGDLIGSDVRTAYYGGTALTGTGQSLGLFEFAGYNLADVATYFTKLHQTDTVPVVGVPVNGASLDCKAGCDDAEQVLDIEEAVAMAPGLRQVVVYVGHQNVSILNAMAADDTSAQLSCSWGWNRNPSVIDPILEEFAAQGQTFLVATGDYGYHLKAGAVWPADDAYATAVGGTDLSTAGPGGPWQHEIGWKYSGGGPSPDGIPIPAYQVPFVTAQNGGSTTLRNVPDIAGDANTNNYSCYDGGCSTGNGGTSYAAPLWAGYTALANQLAAALGRRPVGFLNPTVYRIGGHAGYFDYFHDQRYGYNGKYSAATGFDLVTGFGSPNGPQLIDRLARGF